MDASTPRRMYVEWADHAFHEGSYNKEEAHRLGLSSQSSVGYLVYESSEAIAIAQTYTVHHTGDVEYGEVLTIGKAMVRVVREVTFSTTEVDTNVVA